MYIKSLLMLFLFEVFFFATKSFSNFLILLCSDKYLFRTYLFFLSTITCIKIKTISKFIKSFFIFFAAFLPAFIIIFGFRFFRVRLLLYIEIFVLFSSQSFPFCENISKVKVIFINSVLIRKRNEVTFLEPPVT